MEQTGEHQQHNDEIGDPAGPQVRHTCPGQQAEKHCRGQNTMRRTRESPCDPDAHLLEGVEQNGVAERADPKSARVIRGTGKLPSL